MKANEDKDTLKNQGSKSRRRVLGEINHSAKKSPSRKKTRRSAGRRVSFASALADIRTFERDVDWETPPDKKPASTEDKGAATAISDVGVAAESPEAAPKRAIASEIPPADGQKEKLSGDFLSPEAASLAASTNASFVSPATIAGGQSPCVQGRGVSGFKARPATPGSGYLPRSGTPVASRKGRENARAGTGVPDCATPDSFYDANDDLRPENSFLSTDEVFSESGTPAEVSNFAKGEQDDDTMDLVMSPAPDGADVSPSPAPAQPSFLAPSPGIDMDSYRAHRKNSRKSWGLTLAAGNEPTIDLDLDERARDLLSDTTFHAVFGNSEMTGDSTYFSGTPEVPPMGVQHSSAKGPALETAVSSEAGDAQAPAAACQAPALPRLSDILRQEEERQGAQAFSMAEHNERRLDEETMELSLSDVTWASKEDAASQNETMEMCQTGNITSSVPPLGSLMNETMDISRTQHNNITAAVPRLADILNQAASVEVAPEEQTMDISHTQHGSITAAVPRLADILSQGEAAPEEQTMDISHTQHGSITAAVPRLADILGQ
ncbi:hypothetical protein CYMTET_9751, partial [Cymbomonas tetramitiformis]